MIKKTIHNPHAGEILKSEFLNELNISNNTLALAINLPVKQVYTIIHGQRNITADTDLRLCNFFELSKGYFLRLQEAHDFLNAKRSSNN